jgi:hypothetical protein
LEVADTKDQLLLLDTAGYGADELGARQLQEIHAAVSQADLVLLVVPATHPARQADLHLLDDVAEWFASQLHRKPPPVLAVLTHIDGLSPRMEWRPPYDWQSGSGSKERSVRGALDYVREELGERVAGAIPVCADLDRHREDGIPERLLPAMVALLNEARACALIRTLHDDADRRRVRQVFAQLFHAGRGLLTGLGWD